MTSIKLYINGSSQLDSIYYNNMAHVTVATKHCFLLK